MRLFITTLSLGLICLLMSCGSRQSVTPPQSAANSNSELSNEAQTTYFQHMRAVRDGLEPSKDEIPAKYWTEQIKALNPIKIYHHRVNLVIVQRMADDVEEGIYVYIPISSYLPQSGDDGFEFKPNPSDGESYSLGDGVLKFRRTLSESK